MISKRDFPKWLLPSLLFLGTAVLVWAMPYFSQIPVFKAIEQFAFTIGEEYERWFSQQKTNNPLILWGLSFAGGLVASISPCILSLLPVNLSYIGTREIASRKDAVVKASSFVLGVVTILSLLGLFSSFAGIVLVKFRGYFHIAVGILIMIMGFSLAGLIHLPLPPSPTGGSIRTTSPVSEPWASLRGRIRVFLTGPYGVGLTFALVSSPCTSPVMVAVLVAGAATGSQLQSMLMMVSYALGYTAIIFLASLFTGLAKQTRSLLMHSQTVVRIASLIMLAIGGLYLINGLRWVFAILK